MTRVFASLAAILFALPVFAVEMGDDGLHKTAVDARHLQGYMARIWPRPPPRASGCWS
jgi:hypothetical protein